MKILQSLDQSVLPQINLPGSEKYAFYSFFF